MLSLACKTGLKSNEEKWLIKSLHTDKELVFHINMTPSKLPDLLINNQNIALELLICMNNTHEITRYYDVLASMKLSTNLLEAFYHLSNRVEMPQDFTRLFLKNIMN